MNARILVVEDEEALTTLLRYNLDAEGYDVETVGRGDEADTRLKERIPDLVVLDWMLPGLSGIELCRRLRARPETRQVAISRLTGRGGAQCAVVGPRGAGHGGGERPGVGRAVRPPRPRRQAPGPRPAVDAAGM